MFRLDGDVLLRIFTFSDIHTILSLSQVNKYLWEVSRTKQLWISVIRNLGSRQMLDRAVDEILEESSTEALIAEVKRAVVGPHTWSRNSVSPPTISRQITIPFTGDQTPYMEFLPGGRQILFYTWYSENDIMATPLVLWDIHLARQIWRQTLPGHILCMKFKFRVEDEVVMCFWYQDTEGHHIFLVEVNTSTGVSGDSIHLSVAATSNLCQLEILGDYVVQVTRTAQQSVVVLIKISTRKFIVLSTSETQRPAVGLFPAHVAIAYPLPDISSSANINLYAISSLKHFGVRSANSALITVAIFAIFLRSASMLLATMVKMFLSESPVHEATYELVVMVIDRFPRPSTSLLGRVRNRFSKTRGPSESDSWTKTVSRYNIPLPVATASPPDLPQPTLVSVLRQTTLCPFADGPLYVRCHDGYYHQTAYLTRERSPSTGWTKWE
ncbi:hypothetical protein K438DRAFT_2014783 [Mycena galopus ATCC 62051]|nr:hypothetical protein K438DRAFT_2014783 [Mycena galopus ATCC 62051]